ncbi:MAG: hypothetical protein L0312_28045, partial [Acidobacteria bacterium]|nr:hypothetical protein [Acidobacteriota bacterium]
PAALAPPVGGAHIDPRFHRRGDSMIASRRAMVVSLALLGSASLGDACDQPFLASASSRHTGGRSPLAGPIPALSLLLERAAWKDFS